MTTECSEIVGQICERMRAVNAELAMVRAESDRYRAALLELIGTRRWVEFWNERGITISSTESGPISDDSGPIAEAGK